MSYRAECMCGEVVLVDSLESWRAFEQHIEICDLVATTTPPSASDEDRAPRGTPGADGPPTPGAGSTAPSVGVSGERAPFPGRRRRVIAEGMRHARIDQLGNVAANTTRLIVETEDYLRRTR